MGSRSRSRSRAKKDKDSKSRSRPKSRSKKRSKSRSRSKRRSKSRSRSGKKSRSRSRSRSKSRDKQRDQSPALVQRSAPSQGLDPTVQSLDLDLGQNPEGTSVPPQGPTVRIEKQRKLAVAQNPVQHQDLNHRWKMGINLDPDQTQKLLKKWSKTEEIRSLSKMEMSESHYFDILKNN